MSIVKFDVVFVAMGGNAFTVATTAVLGEDVHPLLVTSA
jgi:hypothetical protein